MLSYDFERQQQPMNRLPATFGFKAVIKHIPWSTPTIVIPFYAVLSYAAFKVFWRHIIRKAGTTTQEKDEPDGRN